jgi:glycerophosphoryl diester phosphodiesterase
MGRAMSPTRRDLAAFGLAAPLAWALGETSRAAVGERLVIATAAAAGPLAEGAGGVFDVAIHDGADFIAADFTPCKDGALVALSDHELSAVTDVAKRPEFAERKQTRTVDGEDRTGWFAEDFTLPELKSLGPRVPSPRRKGAPSGQAILTFGEVVDIARAGCVRTARVIGVYAGLSHPAYFAGVDLAVEPLLANAIRVAGYDSPAAAMWVSCDDPASLKTIGELTRARRVMRLGEKADISPAGLKAIRADAEAVAPWPGQLLDFPTPKTVKPTALIAGAHAAGLAVHAWIVDVPFPPPPLKANDAEHLMALLFTWGADAIAGPRALPIARARDQSLHAKR